MIRTPIRKVSAKAAKRFRGRAKVYNELDHEWEPGSCRGCGRWEEVIDHSHLLSQAKYPHLAANKKNIAPHCRHCHQLWENPAHQWKLKDYVPNMIYIQSVDAREFERMLVQTEWKLEKHYPEELPRFYEVRDSLI